MPFAKLVFHTIPYYICVTWTKPGGLPFHIKLYLSAWQCGRLSFFFFLYFDQLMTTWHCSALYLKHLQAWHRRCEKYIMTQVWRLAGRVHRITGAARGLLRLSNLKKNKFRRKTNTCFKIQRNILHMTLSEKYITHRRLVSKLAGK